jgi:hypothetical protein
VAVIILIAALANGCRHEREEPPQVTASDEGVRDPTGWLKAQGLYLGTSSETDARVQKVFPKGVASEDAREAIGIAPPPPDDRAPDPTCDVVIAIEVPTAIDLATVRKAVNPRPKGNQSFVKALTTAGKWEYVDDRTATGPYNHVAVTVSFVDIDAPVSAAALDREIEWARTALGSLGKGAPTVSMSRAQAVAKASAVFKLKQTLTDDALDAGLMIVAPKGKKFRGRLIWDVVYSAGFRWGDGDYFHWVPSADTDVSQGIGMGTSTGSTYFMPEWVAKDDGSADVDDLEMSFNVARAWQPEAMFDVMVRASHYMARRLGGTVLSKDGAPFDEASARARVQSIVTAMSAAGLTPGSGLALRVF